jgi:nucleoid-associated protein YgaU
MGQSPSSVERWIAREQGVAGPAGTTGLQGVCMMGKSQDEISELKRQVREQAKARSYVVKSGDSLSKIAEELLGDADRWREIFEANKDKIEDPNAIEPGQKLDIPS